VVAALETSGELAVLRVDREAKTLTTTARIPVGWEPSRLLRVDDTLWVGHRMEQSVRILDAVTLEERERLEVQCVVDDLGFTAGGDISITCRGRDELLLADPSGSLRTVPLPGDSWDRPGCGLRDQVPVTLGAPATVAGTLSVFPGRMTSPYSGASCDLTTNTFAPGLFPARSLDRMGDAHIWPVLFVMDAEERLHRINLLTSDADGFLRGGMPTRVLPLGGRDVLVADRTGRLAWRVALPELPSAPSDDMLMAQVDVLTTSVGFTEGELTPTGYHLWSPVVQEVWSLSDGDLIQSAAFPSTLPELTQRGREAFNDSTWAVGFDSDVGITCATCHLDGRADGLSWAFAEDWPLSTLSLLVPLEARTGFGWYHTEPFVLLEEVAVTSTELSGDGFGEEVAQGVLDWLDLLPDVGEAPPGTHDLDQVARGKALFEGDGGCIRCHSGPEYSDFTRFRIQSGKPQVRVPPLLKVVTTPPYLHDGTAPTLRDALDLPLMAPPTPLTEAQKDDIVAFLKTL